MTHKVWEILNRNKYTEVGATEIEKLYDSLDESFRLIGKERVKIIYDALNNYNDEVFDLFQAAAL